MYAIVILIGGKGTRVSNLLKNKSKPEIEINKKRIIDYQLKQLSYLNKKIIFLSNVFFFTNEYKEYINKIKNIYPIIFEPKNCLKKKLNK